MGSGSTGGPSAVDRGTAAAANTPEVGKGILDLSGLRGISLTGVEAAPDGAVSYRQAQVYNDQEMALASNVNNYIAKFLGELRESVMDTQGRLLAFSRSADTQPAGAAKELLELVNTRADHLQSSLRDYQSSILNPSSDAGMIINYDGKDELVRNAARVLVDVVSGLSKVSGFLTAIVNAPRVASIESYTDAKGVAADTSNFLGEVLYRDNGIVVTESGFRSRT